MSVMKEVLETVSTEMTAFSKYYSAQQSEIAKSIGAKIPIYTQCLALTYTVFNIPKQLFINKLPIFWKMGLGLFYDIMSGWAKGVVSLLDWRTYKNLGLTIIAITKNCIAKPIKRFMDKIIKCLTTIFSIFKKFFRMEKDIKRVKGTISQNDYILLENKVTDWLKSAATAALRPFKKMLITFLKTGYNTLEKLFLTFVMPIAECISTNNKMSGAMGVGENIGKTIAAKIGKSTAIKSTLGAATAGSLVAGITHVSLFMGVIGGFGLALLGCSLLTLVGHGLIIKNAFIDCFEGEKGII